MIQHRLEGGCEEDVSKSELELLISYRAHDDLRSGISCSMKCDDGTELSFKINLSLIIFRSSKTCFKQLHLLQNEELVDHQMKRFRSYHQSHQMKLVMKLNSKHSDDNEDDGNQEDADESEIEHRQQELQRLKRHRQSVFRRQEESVLRSSRPRIPRGEEANRKEEAREASAASRNAKMSDNQRHMLISSTDCPPLRFRTCSLSFFLPSLLSRSRRS